MEKVLSPAERLRRAEQLYYSRKGVSAKENKKNINVPISNRNFLLKKMIIQIIVCFLIYSTYFVIKNYQLFFSQEIMEKTNQVLSYDINIQEIYCKIANYIKNYDFFNQKEQNQNTEETNKAETNENMDNVEINEIEENSVAESNSEEESISDSIIETNAESTPLSQMELDANDIKQKYEFITPVQGQITSRYGPREVTQPVISPYHVGLDIAANTGTVIRASMNGTVVHSGELGGYGNCIQTQIDDLLIIYGHCSKLYVKAGDIVEKGQAIGEVGSTGNATGPHLHFEIRKSERYVDPELIF